MKKEIEKLTSISVDKQRIIFKAKMLDDSFCLHDYIKEDDQTIHLLAKITSKKDLQNQEHVKLGMNSVEEAISNATLENPVPGINDLKTQISKEGVMYSILN